MKCSRSAVLLIQLIESKYKFMQVNRIQNLQRLQSSIPDLQRTLDTVKFLECKKVSRHCQKGADDRMQKKRLRLDLS